MVVNAQDASVAPSNASTNSANRGAEATLARPSPFTDDNIVGIITIEVPSALLDFARSDYARLVIVRTEDSSVPQDVVETLLGSEIVDETGAVPCLILLCKDSHRDPIYRLWSVSIVCSPVDHFS